MTRQEVKSSWCESQIVSIKPVYREFSRNNNKNAVQLGRLEGYLVRKNTTYAKVEFGEQ